MSSLRLALKQSLSEAPSTKSSKKKKNKFIYTPTPFGLSDKELRKLEKQRKAEARANSRSKKGDDDGGGEKDVEKRLKKRKEKDLMKKKLKEERKLKKIKRKERQDELQRAIEGNGGTEIHIGVGGGSGEGGGGLVTGTLKSGVDAKDGDGGGSVSSSTLSSSSSGSSSSSDSDDSSDSSSSSSESSDSDDDSSSSSDSDDDDDESSSDDDSSSEEEGEVKDDDSLDSSSSSSGDSSDDTIEAADRETKELFDADLSSDDEKESVKDTAEADDKRRKRRLKKKSKMLKAFKKKDDAANMIATHWKKKKSIGSSAGEKDGTPDTPGDTPNDNNDGDKDFSPEKSAKEDTVSKTVESPSPEILQHIRTMSTKLQRKNIQSGLRVKVRFVKKANINGRLTRKLKWYGGVVAGIANSGRKIKIQYDDGTSEVADFPDKDIIVDDVNNGRHNCGSGGAGIMGGGGGDPGGAFVPLPPSPTKSEENDDDGVDDESNESEEEVDDTPMDPDSPEKKKVKKKKKKKDTGEERSEENVVQQKKKKKRASEDRGDDGHSSNLPLGYDDDGLDSGALQRRRRSSNSERSDRDTLSKKNRGPLSDVSESDEIKKSKRRESASDMSISSNGEQTDTSPIKMKPAPSALSSVPGNDKNDADAKNELTEKDEKVVEEGTAEEENLSQDDKSVEVDTARVVHESKGDDEEMPFVQKDDSKDTKDELEMLKPEDVPEEGDVAEEKVEKDAPSTNPGIDNTAASSSSGSTCSDSSFAGVAAPIATSVDGNVLDSADVKLPSHVDVQVEKGEQTVPGTDEQDTDMTGDDEEVQGETLGPAGKEGQSVTKSGSETEDQESKEKLPSKKKRGPLSIHIGLPKRKKQEHNQTDSNDAYVGAAASELEEPSKKKQKVTVEGVINPSSELENTVKMDETLDSNNSPLDGEETPATKGDNDKSLPDGEIEEEGKVQEEGGKIEEDGTLPMEVEPTKIMESNTEHDVPSEPKLSPTTNKKPKLSIHISTKKRKKLQQENKLDETAEAIAEPEQDVANDGTSKQSDAAMQLPLDDADKGAEEKDATHPPPATLLKEEKEAPSASPRLEGDKSDNDKKPPSSAGTSTNPSPAPEDAVGTEGGSKYSMARSGRKAAKIAAEKISKKKPRKTSEKKKKEEDPWVQCDRCHKWRHLPASVDLDTLPEHWFCELNTYDAKRNNCEAEEQTPKEVAKEKKRMKKLQKLQELAKADSEAREAAAASAGAMEAQKLKGRKRSQSPKNGSDKETEFDTPQEKTMLDSGARGSKNNIDDDDNANTSGGESPKPLFPKKKRGRPRNVDKERAAGKGKDEPKQEWVQCEKCEKWRRLPPRISAADLPDVWYCSMNTWDINMATCTAIEDKHELSPSRPAQYNEQSQIPTGFGSSSKLSYRNLIFGSGRLKKSISERMRAQESLFSSQQEEEVDMSMPPTVMYANSNVFFNKSLQKANSLENEAPQTSIFDIASHSRVWQELNNNAPIFHMQSNAAYNSVGLSKFCQPNGSLNQEAVDTLKAMLYFSLAGGKMLVPHEILLEVQCQDWNYGVPAHWMELRSLCTIEITTFILDELIKDGLVEIISDPKSLPSLENAFYRRRTEALPGVAP